MRTQPSHKFACPKCDKAVAKSNFDWTFSRSADRLIAGPAVPVVADLCCEPEEVAEGAEVAEPATSLSDLAAEAEAASRAASALNT